MANKKKSKKKKSTTEVIKTTSHTTIPTFHAKFEEIKKYLIKNSHLKMLLIDTSKINKIEHEYGKKVYGDVLNALSKIIASLRGSQIREDDIITVNHPNGDQFYIFFSTYRKEKSFQPGDLEDVSQRIKNYINNKMFTTVYALLKKRPQINVGYAITIYNPLIQEERLINKLIEDAKTIAEYEEFKTAMKNKEKLQELIIKEEITTIYQPIVNLTTHEIIGYEALSRGPKNTEYEHPYALFSIAEEVGLLFELDSICRRKAFINAKGIKKGLKLFVNIFPTTIHDPDFRGKYLKDFLNDIKISPRSVVLEVSEQQVIENFDIFKEAIKYYSDVGFAIAIDDTGTGYSNLQSLTKLKVQFIKIDISLIRDIDKNILKQDLVKALTKVSNDMGAKVIAEGIENTRELKTLMDLDITYGQGYLFARPAPPFPNIKPIEI